MRFADRIPVLRYNGSVTAFGAYGAPTLAGVRITWRSAIILALLGAIVALYFAGVLDASHAFALGAGPIAATSAPRAYHGLVAQRDELESAFDAIKPAADGSYTDEQNVERDAILADHRRVEAEISRHEERRSWERTAAGVPDSGQPSATEAPKPFRTLGEQLKAVARAAMDKHAPVHPGLVSLNEWNQAQAAASGANELIGSDGGFAVQTDFEDGLLQRVYARSILAGLASEREIGPNANGVKINHIDETSRADGSRFGGVRAYWTGEAGSLTSSRPKMSQIELNLAKLTGLYYATDEELLDAVALQSGVEEMFPAEFGFKLDDAIVRGTGAGMPMGWLNAAATVSVAKESGQAAATIYAENVEKMFARCWAPSIPSAVWYINQDIYPQLFAMQHVIGTGGVPVFLPPGGLSGAPFGTLFGRPVQPIEQASTLGTVGDINLVDMSEYRIIKKGGIATASSIHVLFTTDEMAFRWVLRVNGKPKWLSALTPYKGSSTLSPFVTLATRS